MEELEEEVELAVPSLEAGFPSSVVVGDGVSLPEEEAVEASLEEPVVYSLLVAAGSLEVVASLDEEEVSAAGFYSVVVVDGWAEVSLEVEDDDPSVEVGYAPVSEEEDGVWLEGEVAEASVEAGFASVLVAVVEGVSLEESVPVVVVGWLETASVLG